MTDYGVLFRELAIPRLVGTPNHQRVRAVLKRELSARGFAVEEHAFSGRPARALLGAPKRVSGINLIAQPPARSPGRPTVWLVAHYDSKGQPISMALRLAGFGAILLGLLLLATIPIPGLAIAVCGVIVISQNRVTNTSPGALDNATAVVAVFMALDQLPPHESVGVIFPDAEEYGLVGSRALAADRTELFRNAAVVNLDGLDDVGRPTVFLHRPGPTGLALAGALKARTWRWLPVIVDGIALSRVSRECATILKGTVKTMQIVHTPGDTADRVRLDGAASVAAGLARVLRRE